MRGYEELICNKIASLAYLGMMNYYMILYTPQDMHHLNLTHHSDKDVYSIKIAINTRFANKEIHAKKQPMRG